jgi:hypothetical protein
LDRSGGSFQKGRGSTRAQAGLDVEAGGDRLIGHYGIFSAPWGEGLFHSMFDYLKIVEKRIKEAQEKGEFDNLPGQGKPLDMTDDRHIPEDLRLAYKILKNADCLPPELEETKEIRQMEDMLANVPDEKERYKLIKKINYKIMKLNVARNRSPLLDEKEIYYKKLVDKLDKK